MLKQVDRGAVIQLIQDCFADDPRVYAFWLEGSDGTGTVDEFSDLDIVLDVEDGVEETILSELEVKLGELGELDLNYGPEHPDNGLWYKVYHIAGTAETLLLDVTVQSHSRSFEFIIENKNEIPKVIFDKQSVIRFGNLDSDQMRDNLEKRIRQLEGTFQQRIRAVKYAQKNQFLEAHAYYHKYVLNPLVEMIRIRHTPLIHDYYLVHISRHLPGHVLQQLEDLYKNSSTDDILANIERAVLWFHSISASLKQKDRR